MIVLLYNFIQPEDGGGGVGVYIANLAASLQDAGHRVIILSSGDEYAFTSRAAKLRTWRDKYERAVIVNSPVIAPALVAFDDPAAYTGSKGLSGMPQALRRCYGDIDVFHFQNVEGLTRSFFDDLRLEFPSARMIYSVHNYNIICPQGDLWHQDREVCRDYRNGAACTACILEPINSSAIRESRRRRPLVAALDQGFPGVLKAAKSARAALKAGDAVKAGPPAPTRPETDGRSYALFRQSNISLGSEMFDHVLAVSQRTQDVLVAQGMSPANISVSYIGTKHKAAFITARQITDIGDGLHVAYLGYMRHSKGFSHVLDSFEQMSADDLGRITLTVAAKRSDQGNAYQRLMAISPRFAGFHYYDGYSHAELDTILAGVNLGLVPPLWEDNLPQVAIELVSRGVPILTSDRGGAQEIAAEASFTFRTDSPRDLPERLAALARKEIVLASFWSNPIRIYSLEEHVQDLERYYAARQNLL